MEVALASLSRASGETAAAPAATASRFESFRSGLSKDQLAVFEEIMVDHKARVRKLKEMIRAEDAKVEFTKGEATSQKLSLLGISK